LLLLLLIIGVLIVQHVLFQDEVVRGAAEGDEAVTLVGVGRGRAGELGGDKGVMLLGGSGGVEDRHLGLMTVSFHKFLHSGVGETLV